MTDPAIPTAAQVRAIRPTSVQALKQGLKKLGLTVREGGARLLVEIVDGIYIGSMPLSKATPQALLNCRSYLVKQVERLAEPTARTGGTP